ncbi:MAG: hypothetical protein ACI85Q_000409 [Salibacteraceae bacterium]|jgi:hypothetical protein
MAHIASVILFLFLAGTKLLIAPGIMLASGMGIIETIFITYFGAVIGAIVFYYFGVTIFKWWDGVMGTENKSKHIFSRKSRVMVKVKTQYGIIGVAAMAPIISIPISALIVAKFFPDNKKVVPIYALVFIPVSIGLTFLSEPVIIPIVKLVKEIFI